MKNNIPTALSQIYEKQLRNGRIALFTKINNFKCGELDPSDSTFYCVHRSSKNIMRMFYGLGINEHILTQYNFTYIVVPFNNTELRTTREKWLESGIASPFCNSVVDKQVILPLSKINLSFASEDIKKNNQYSLFNLAEVI